jgi:ATP phosphoribosyltransferase regulatory subunit
LGEKRGAFVNRPKAKFLQVPAGSTTLFHADALMHRRVTQVLNSLFESWGYMPVQTPLLDYAAPYHGLIADEDLEHTHHLIGRDGAVLILRSDVTLFLAKQLSTFLRDSEESFRYCYADTIVRHQEDDDIARNEYFQAGAELIGVSGQDGDAEILLLLAESLLALNQPCAALHVGSRAFFNACFADVSLDLRAELARCVRTRNFDFLKELLRDCADSGALTRWKAEPEAVPGLACAIFSTICSADRASEVLKDYELFLPDDALHELTYIIKLLQLITLLSPPSDFRFDPSEIGNQTYHSGIAFKVYSPGLDSALAMGGRYDTLLSQLSCPRPAVGFSIMLSKLHSKKNAEKELVPETLQNTEFPDFANRYRHASVLRREGRKVCL